jgi:hypothetical protein
VPRLRINGAIPPFLLHAFMAWTRKTHQPHRSTAAKHRIEMGDLMFQDIEVITRTSVYMGGMVKEVTQ